MKLNKFKMLAVSLACLYSSLPALASEMEPQGLNNRVEWTARQQWQAPANSIDFTHSLDLKLAYFLTADAKVYVYTSTGKQLGFIPVPEGVDKIDIAPQGEVLFLLDSKTNTFHSVAIDFVVDINTAGSPAKGEHEAPVTIVVFTDFECPYCSKLAPLLDQVYDANRKNVKIVFKNLPLNFHQNAEPAARAGLAASKQGKFWEYHDILFANQPQLGKDFYLKTAKDLGLDLEKFKKDMNSSPVQSKIKKDIYDAQLAGVTGTPTVFINGRKLKQRSLQGFQQMIDFELQKTALQDTRKK